MNYRIYKTNEAPDLVGVQATESYLFVNALRAIPYFVAQISHNL